MSGTQVSRLNDPELRKARALAMAERRMKNTAMKDIAVEFNVTVQTVEREIRWIKQQGLFEQFQERILEELIPQALGTFLAAMQNGDTKVAERVLNGSGLLLKPQERVVPAQAPPEADDFETYVRQLGGGASASRTNRLTTGGNDHTGRALPPAREGEVTEGFAVEVTPATSKEVAPSLGSPDDQGRVPRDEPSLGLSADAEGSEDE